MEYLIAISQQLAMLSNFRLPASSISDFADMGEVGTNRLFSEIFIDMGIYIPLHHKAPADLNKVLA